MLYAIGEVALIMLGILLAVQVSKWNQEGQDRREERLILSRLSGELAKNLTKISNLMSGFEVKENALEQVTLVFQGKPIEHDSLFLSHVIKSSLWGWTVQSLQRLIYEEINNTGRLVIVENIDLRNSITELYDFIQVLEGTAMARKSDYASITYTLVPRETESQLKEGLNSDEHSAIAKNVLKSSLGQGIIFEQNRARYLKQMWSIMADAMKELRDKIAMEMNN